METKKPEEQVPVPKLIGWQIVHTETDNPPNGQMTFEIYQLEDVLGWLLAHDRKEWRLLPIFEGDVEEPTHMLIGGIPKVKVNRT